MGITRTYRARRTHGSIVAAARRVVMLQVPLRSAAVVVVRTSASALGLWFRADSEAISLGL